MKGERISFLKDKLSEEITVKESEVYLNQELKLQIEQQEIIIEYLRNNNFIFIKKIAELRNKLKSFLKW